MALKVANEVASVPEEVTGQPRRVVLGHLLGETPSLRCVIATSGFFFGGQLISLIGTWMQNTAQSLAGCMS